MLLSCFQHALDSKFGKVRTIFWLSLVYSLGCIIMSLGAVSNTDEGIKNFPNMYVNFCTHNGCFKIYF